MGVIKDGQIYAGIIYQPQAHKIYYAEKGKGAYVNGYKLKVSATEKSEGAALIYSPTYSKDKEAFELTNIVIDRLKKEIHMSTETLGSQVIETMQVAEGEKDVFIHFKTKPWDIAAAVAIVFEAGRKAYNTKGENYILFEDTILLTNGKLDISQIVKISSQ